MIFLANFLFQKNKRKSLKIENFVQTTPSCTDKSKLTFCFRIMRLIPESRGPLQLRVLLAKFSNIFFLFFLQIYYIKFQKIPSFDSSRRAPQEKRLIKKILSPIENFDCLQINVHWWLAIVTRKKSVLVTIDDHFRRARKFACDY